LRRGARHLDSAGSSEIPAEAVRRLIGGSGQIIGTAGQAARPILARPAICPMRRAVGRLRPPRHDRAGAPKGA